MNKSNTLRKTKWFWAWEDHKEEAWLEEMARQGWRLSSVGRPLVYEFSAGEPAEYVYRLDFITATKGEEYQEYLQLFADAGWEHIGVMSGWQYFRKRAQPGEVSEIFTDNDSKIKKYERLIAFLMIFPVSMVPMYIVLIGLDPSFWKFFVLALYAALICFYAFAMIKLALRIRQLKNP